MFVGTGVEDVEEAVSLWELVGTVTLVLVPEIPVRTITEGFVVVELEEVLLAVMELKLLLMLPPEPVCEDDDADPVRLSPPATVEAAPVKTSTPSSVVAWLSAGPA